MKNPVKNSIVKIDIKKPKRWTANAVSAFQGLTGWVSEVKPETGGCNNVLVTFPTHVSTGTSVHKSFHFLAEDLEQEHVGKRVPLAESKTRRYVLANEQGLTDYVEQHNLTLVWDTSVELPRGVLWTQSEGMAGTVVLGNDGFLLSLETSHLVDWW